MPTPSTYASIGGGLTISRKSLCNTFRYQAASISRSRHEFSVRDLRPRDAVTWWSDPAAQTGYPRDKRQCDRNGPTPSLRLLLLPQGPGSNTGTNDPGPCCPRHCRYSDRSAAFGQTLPCRRPACPAAGRGCGGPLATQRNIDQRAAAVLP